MGFSDLIDWVTWSEEKARVRKALDGIANLEKMKKLPEETRRTDYLAGAGGAALGYTIAKALAPDSPKDREETWSERLKREVLPILAAGAGGVGGYYVSKGLLPKRAAADDLASDERFISATNGLPGVFWAPASRAAEVVGPIHSVYTLFRNIGEGGAMVTAANKDANRQVNEAIANTKGLGMSQVLRAEPGPFVEARRNLILEGLGLAGRDATGNVLYKVNTAPFGAEPVWEDISEEAIKKVNANAQQAQYEAWVRKLGGEKAENLKGLKDYEDQAWRLLKNWDAKKIPVSESFPGKQPSQVRRAILRTENDHAENVKELLGEKSTSGSPEPSKGGKPPKGFLGTLGSGFGKMFGGPVRALGRFPGTKYNLGTGWRIARKTPAGGALLALLGLVGENHYGGNVRYAEGASRRAAQPDNLTSREVKKK